MEQVVSHCRSFAPYARRGARVLVLGSMPGAESLRRRQYYAFPRNAFWGIMGEICGFFPPGGVGLPSDPIARALAVPYPRRLQVLARRGVALWDVLASCERAGSLDSEISRARANDIPGLLTRFPTIERICCNGGAAGRYLKKFYPEIFRRAEVLPSTSPAAARFSYAEKLARWREMLCPVIR